jgi:hypothetical protein
MKRYFISFCVIISIVSIMFVGCGGSKSGGGRKQIKIFETSGGVVYNMPINQSGIVFADSISEIGNEYILFVPNDESVSPNIDVALFDSDGNRQSDIVYLTINGDECIDLTELIDNPRGGKSGPLVDTGKGGKCQLIATCGEISRFVDIWVYDSCSMSGFPNQGINIDEFGIKSNPPITDPDGCVFFNNNGNIYIVGKAYLHGEYVNWKSEFKNIDDFSGINFNLTNPDDKMLCSPLANNKIYIAETPNGGHVKIIGTGNSIIWEYAPPGITSFK